MWPGVLIRMSDAAGPGEHRWQTFDFAVTLLRYDDGESAVTSHTDTHKVCPGPMVLRGVIGIDSRPGS